MEYKGLGLGSMHMNLGNVEDCATVVHTALEENVTFLNTADFYKAGESEMVLGEALKGYDRKQFYISVKFGVLLQPDGGICGLDVHPDRIRNYLTHSLKRLRLDYIDLYQPARIDLAIPVEETIGAISDLVKAGYVRHIGISEVDAATLEKANAVHKIEAVEMEYSLFNRSIEQDIIPAARRLGVGIVAFGIIAHGLMSGTWTKERLARGEYPTHIPIPLFDKDNIGKNIELVDNLRAIAEEKYMTLPQLAHAWALAKGADIIPLIGASKVKNFKDSVKARELPLSSLDMRRIEVAVPQNEIAGNSFPRMRFKNGRVLMP